MIAKTLKLLYSLGVMVAFFLSTGCMGIVNVGELQRETQSVELGEAETVQVEVKMGMGSLKVTGGADRLLNADFSYNVTEWKPEVNYQVSNRLGKLTIKHPSFSGRGKLPLGNVRNAWDLSFNNDIPMKLSIDLGAGENYLQLGHLTLTSLEVAVGAGELTLDLSGNPCLKMLTLNMGTGDVKVDLTGDWQNDLTAQINNGIGRVTIHLPNNVGIFAHADRGIGQVSASGLKRHDGTYMNDAYGESDVTLNLNVDAGIGQINLELAK